jgi:hypothetical protein
MPEDARSADELVASLKGRIGRLEKYLPARQKEFWPAEQRPILAACPICAGEMKSCRVTAYPMHFGYEPFGLLVALLVYLDRYFRPWVKEHEPIVVPDSSYRTACRCRKCGFVAMKQDKCA